MRSSDWSADVCSSDLDVRSLPFIDQTLTGTLPLEWAPVRMVSDDPIKGVGKAPRGALLAAALRHAIGEPQSETRLVSGYFRSEEHTSELQSLMRISYAVFCLKKKRTSLF